MLSLYSWICHLSPSSLTSAHIHPLKKQKFDSFFRLKNQKIQNTLMMNLRRSEHVDVFLQNCKSFPPDPFPSSFLGYDFTTCLHASRWCDINSGTLNDPICFPSFISRRGERWSGWSMWVSRATSGGARGHAGHRPITTSQFQTQTQRPRLMFLSDTQPAPS